MAEYVNFVYESILLRSPTADEAAQANEQLATGEVTAADFAASFLSLPEYINDVTPIERFYQSTLNRVFDTGGLDYWVNVYRGLLDSGLDANSAQLQIASAFIDSPEFTSIYGPIDSLTNEQFVNGLYENVLGREADAGGAAYWNSQLEAGMSRQQLVVEFNNAPEFINNIGETLDTQLLYLQYVEQEATQAQLDQAALEPTDATIESLILSVDPPYVGPPVPPDIAVGDDVSVIEGDSGPVPMEFTVALSDAFDEAVTVNYATQDGTATAGEDYVAASGTLTFAPGQTEQTITVFAVGDLDIEPDETFNVVLSDSRWGAIVEGDGVGTILDDDEPVISIANAELTEPPAGTDQMTFTLTLNKPDPNNEVSVTVTTSDGTAMVADNDYLARTGTVTFAPGATTATFAVTIVSNGEVELDEDFTVTLSDAVNGRISEDSGSATGIILTNDPYVVSIADAEVIEGNVGLTPMTFTVSLNAAPTEATGPITVSYDTSDGTAIQSEDYLPATGEVTFGVDEISKTITVQVLADTAPEPNQEFTVTLSDPNPADGVTLDPATATGLIINDDGAVISIATPDPIEEGNDGTKPLVFEVTLAEPSDVEVTVDYATVDGTAIAGVDFEETSGTLTFAPGVTSQEIVVNIIGDATPEEAEKTFTVQLSDPTNSTILQGTATGTILDNDAGEGLPFIFTDDIDDFTGANGGTAGNDTFIAELVIGADEQVQSLTSQDKANGAGGTDEVYVQMTGFVTTPVMTSIENFFITAFPTTTRNPSTYTASQTTGAEQFWNVSSSDDLTVERIPNLVVAGFRDQLGDYDYNLKFDNALVSGSKDELSVVLDTNEAAGVFNARSQSPDGGGFETLNLQITGKNQFVELGSNDDYLVATKVAFNGNEYVNTLNITGSGSLTIGSGYTAPALPPLPPPGGPAQPGELYNVTSINASTLQGSINVILADLFSPYKGDVPAQPDPNPNRDVTIEGGSGNDTFNFQAGLNSSDNVKGGAGTTDTLIVEGFTAGGTYLPSLLGTGLQVSGVEHLRITDGAPALPTTDAESTNLDNLGAGETDLKLVILAANDVAENFKVININEGVDFRIVGGANDVPLVIPTATGTGDSLLFELGERGVAANVVGQLTVQDIAGTDGIENVTFDTQTFDNIVNSNVITKFVDTTLTNLFIKGAENLTFTPANDVGTTSIRVVDASGLSGNLVINVGDGQGDSATGATPNTRSDDLGVIITGGSGSDTLIAGKFTDIIVGGAGNDTITGALGADRITGGDSGDLFIYQQVADSSFVINSKTGAVDLTADFFSADIVTGFVTGGATEETVVDRFDFRALSAALKEDLDNGLAPVTTITAANQADLENEFRGLTLSKVISQVEVLGGTGKGTYLLVDVNQDGKFDAGSVVLADPFQDDLVIEITGITGVLSDVNFILNPTP